MVTIADRKKLRAYFKRFPKWTIWSILIGVPFLFLYGIGLIGFLVGGVGIYLWYNKIPDSKYDKIFGESINELKGDAMKKLRLEESDLVRSYECITSIVYKNIAGAELGIKRGKDKFLRYTPVGVGMIFFTEHKLCVYQCVLDLITGNPLNVGGKKYFYDDIVSMETQSEAMTINEKNLNREMFKHIPDLKRNIINGKLQLNQSEQFVLTTKGGTSIKIQLPDYTILGNTQNKVTSSRVDQAIASVEAMLDSKKATNP